MRTRGLLGGIALIVASIVGSFALHEYHAVRRVACADYGKGDDHIAFLHPCVASTRTRWAEFGAFAVLFIGLAGGGSLIARPRWSESTSGGERGRRVAVR